jgi:hypothetical protein
MQFVGNRGAVIIPIPRIFPYIHSPIFCALVLHIITEIIESQRTCQFQRISTSYAARGRSATMLHQEETATDQIESTGLSKWLQGLRTNNHKSCGKDTLSQIPTTTPTRLVESLHDEPLEPGSLALGDAPSKLPSKETLLYLAYGSNLCCETFRKKRGIKPVSQINVVVPELVLTFDLPGLPYSEPCFANTRYRQAPGPGKSSQGGPDGGRDEARWHKGLVGVVYEVTLADYAHIIATEGGGASYKDVLVDCYALSKHANAAVPMNPSGTPFKAHTLLAPAPTTGSGRRLRPNPDYAQPSPRYLKLITDGADELALPNEYQSYLHSLHSYRMTTTEQRLGQFIFLSIWVPLVAFIFGAGRIFADKNGRYPAWLAILSAIIFGSMWASYDSFFKGLFGDGERTVETGSGHLHLDEKQPLLSETVQGKFRDVLDETVTSGGGIV